MEELKNKLSKMTPREFEEMYTKVQWNIKVDKYVDDMWREFQEEHGKMNKSQLMQWLLLQYMECHKNNDEK